MRNVLLTGAALAALTTASYAADMPVYTQPEPAVAPAVFSWTGAYIGAHGGWNWADLEPNFFDPLVPASGSLDIGSSDGFVVGGQIGYNWQLNYWVLGLEADGSFVDNSATGLGFEGFAADHEQNFLASIRGRVGFAVDRFLIYGTGGAAWTGLDVGFADPLFFDDEATFFGWVAGGGIEYAITDNVTFGVEYLHYEFSEETWTQDLILPADFDIGLSNDVVRGRLNIKFDSLFN